MAHSDPLAGIELRPATAAQQIATMIRERILSGELEPGAALTEARLVSAFSVSRHTVREVIRMLVNQGIVTQHAFRGATVTQLTVKDVRDIFRVRRLIELPAIDAGAQATPEQLQLLAVALDALDTASREDNWWDLAEADLAFHKALAGLLGSERVARMYEQLQSELRLCLLIVDRHGRERPDSLVAEQSPQGMVDEHREIFDLIRSGKRRLAKQRLTETLDLAERYLVSVYTESS